MRLKLIKFLIVCEAVVCGLVAATMASVWGAPNSWPIILILAFVAGYDIYLTVGTFMLLASETRVERIDDEV